MNKTARITLWVVVIVGALLGIARLTAIRWVRIPDDPSDAEYRRLAASVTPTLRGGDWVLLWRLTRPGYGDLVFCPEPDAPGRFVVARIVGEPGDDVSIDGDELVVNKRRVISERGCNPRTFTVRAPESDETVEQTCDEEVLGNRTHMKLSAGTDATPGRASTASVPDGKVFLVSDNRRFPYDSRDYGVVDRASCRETVVLRLWSRQGWFDSTNRLNLIR